MQQTNVNVIVLLVLVLLAGCQPRSGAAGDYLVTFSWDKGLRQVQVVRERRDQPLSARVRETVVKEAEPIIAEALKKANLTKAEGRLGLKLLGDPPYLVPYASIEIVHPSFQDLLTAAEADDVDKIGFLISRDQNVNQRDLGSGYSALFIAASASHVKVIAKLLELHADPNITDTDGDTPLAVAVVADCAPCIKLLLDAGAQVNCADSVGLTPLMRSADLGRVAILEQLLRSGANPRLKAKNGKTALMFARESGQKQAATILERVN
jgi:hypothetical protein